MPERIVTCYACGRAQSFNGVVPRTATCEGCGADLHCCRTCRFYDEAAYNQCTESSAERVLEKDRANFCDYHSPATGAGAAPARSVDATSELEKLFKKP